MSGPKLAPITARSGEKVDPARLWTLVGGGPVYAVGVGPVVAEIGFGKVEKYAEDRRITGEAWYMAVLEGAMPGRGGSVKAAIYRGDYPEGVAVKIAGGETLRVKRLIKYREDGREPAGSAGVATHMVFGDLKNLYAVALDGSAILEVRAVGPRTAEEAKLLTGGQMVELNDAFEIVGQVGAPR